MNLLKNDIKNAYIEIINNYFNEWNSIKNVEEYKKFSAKIPPKFGTYENVTILEQIEHFLNLGVQLECNEISFKSFKDEIKDIYENLRLYCGIN